MYWFGVTFYPADLLVLQVLLDQVGIDNKLLELMKVYL